MIINCDNELQLYANSHSINIRAREWYAGLLASLLVNSSLCNQSCILVLYWKLWLFFIIFVHCRGVGCVLFEMATGQPLFPGSAIDNQLELIFRTLGTPTETSWPGVSSCRSFEPYKFLCYKQESLVSSAPRYLDFDHTTLCLKKTTLTLHTITSMHINRFWLFCFGLLYLRHSSTNFDIFCGQ